MAPLWRSCTRPPLEQVSTTRGSSTESRAPSQPHFGQRPPQSPQWLGSSGRWPSRMFERRDKGVKNGNSGLIRGHVSCPVIIGVVIADAHYK